MAKKRPKDKRPFWTADCETDPFKNGRVPQPFIWGLYTGASYHEFSDIPSFVEFICDCDVIIYFHNGGKFDIFFLLQHLNLCEPVTVINGRLVVGHIGKAEIRDSWNILPVPLAKYKKDSEAEMRAMLAAEGCSPDLACDYALMEAHNRSKPGVRRVIQKYLRNDCVFLYELVEAFERTEGRHLTIAGAAMARWVRISGVKKPSTDRNFYRFFSPWYNGGRVQCFHKGVIDGPFHVYDMRSAYMWAMKEEHPWGDEYFTTPNPSKFTPRSFLQLTCRSNGALPWRDAKGNLSFPDDGETREYHIMGHELIAAQETGDVSNLKIQKSHDFTQTINFEEYVDLCHNARMAARADNDKAGDLIEKLFGTNLYGKWAANPDNYGNFMCVPFQEFENYRTDGYEFNGMIGPHALMRAPLDEWQCHFLNLATASSITSMVRARLWRAIRSAHIPYYTDTDSVICAVAPDLDIGEHLGQWQHEGCGDTLYIAGKKMYLCEGGDFAKGKYRDEPKMATKGVRLTPAQIRRAARGESVTYEPQAPTFSLFRKPSGLDSAEKVMRKHFPSRTVKMT